MPVERGLNRDPAEFEVPQTFFEKHPEWLERMPLPVNSKLWFDREYSQKLIKDMWAAPDDARCMQQHRTRQCYFYFTDFYRCKELLGEDYKQCQFFKKCYKDTCPPSWLEKWESAVEEGRFPMRFDR